MLNQRSLFIITAIFAGALTRLLPHPWNMTAIGAIAMFGGAYVSNRFLAILIPVLATWVSDLVLNNTLYASANGQFMWFYDGFWLQYGAVAACVVLSIFVFRSVTATRFVVGSLSTALLFYVLTNFGVWAGSTLYPQTTTGLVAAFAAGLPFLGGSLLGNLFYGGLLFGGFELAGRRFPKLATRKA